MFQPPRPQPNPTAAFEQYEEHLVDVLDVGREYVEAVRVYLDRGLDLYHLPRESAERLGRLAADGENYLLMADWVVARAGAIQVAGQDTQVWTVPVSQLVTRPAAGTRPTE